MQSFEQIISDLKNKIYKPIYFLMGEESYYIDVITHYIEKNALPEEEQSFNQSVFYGKDTDLATLLSTARRFPMMSNHNVVILREGQDMKGIDGVGKGAIDPFQLYIENAPPSTILVVNYRGKSLDKRKKIYKELDKHAVLFESKKLYDNQVGQWIVKYIASKGLTIEARASELMANHIGNDLSKVVNEVGKLELILPQGTTISSKDIEEHIGISKDFNVFELQNAMGKKDVYRANLIVNHMGKNPKTKSIIPMITTLYSFFTKVFMIHYATDKNNNSIAALIGIRPFFVNDYLVASRNYDKAKCAQVIGLLRTYDAMSKGIDSPAVSDQELMREMVYKIIH